MIPFDEFQKRCEKGACSRNTIISGRCLKIQKQKRCYDKWLNKLIKEITSENNEEENKFISEVLERDKRKCWLWEVLTQEQKQFILEVYPYEYAHLSKILDVCHIVPRSQSKNLKYDIDNVIICSRYFHTLLDKLKHPVTQSNISSDERRDWFLRAYREMEEQTL